MKKRFAVLASAALVAATLLNPFALSVSALETNKEQMNAAISQALQQEPTAQPSAQPSAEPSAEPSTEPSAEPSAQPSAEPSAQPSAEPETTEVPKVAALSEQDLKSEIESILQQGASIAQMKEEDLEATLQKIEEIQKAPLAISDEESSQEMDNLLEQLSNVQAAMEDMRAAYQAQKDGTLNQLPQTGKENSWRYQNGERIDQQPEELSLNLPDGVTTLSANGYWGIDVSHHQGVIDWNAVKAAGIDFAIIRCGYGMNLEEQDDKQWSRNVSECERLGIPYGVYFYSYATDTSMAAEEAAHALRLLKGRHPDLPVFYDMEENRQLVVGNSGLAAMARTFCEALSANGYEVGVYASLNWWNYYLTDGVFENWYRWVAEWRSSCSYNGRYEMWQYTDRGTINGISDVVDMNYWYADISSKNALIKQGTYNIASALNQNQVLDVEQGSREDGGNVALFHQNNALNQRFEIIPNGDGTYKIRNVNSGKYLDVANNGTTPGTNVLQWSGKDVDNQKWSFEDAGDGYYYIRSVSSGLYLDVYNGQSSDGTNVLVYSKKGGTNQKFRLLPTNTVSVTSGRYLIASALNENQVLDVEQGSRENGGNILLFHRNGAANQTFEIMSNGDGTYKIRNVNSGKYIDVENNGMDPGTNVLQWTGKDVANQRWVFEDAGNGYYYIRSVSSGLYLDVYNGQSSDGTSVLIYSPKGGTNQKFRLVATNDSSVVPGRYVISSGLNDNQVLDVEQGSRQDGANVALFHRNGASNQNFEITPNGDGTYGIRNVNSGKYLDVANNGTTPGTNVLQWTGKGGANQKWFFEDAGNGYYYIRSASSGLYLDVYNNQSADGTNVLVYTKNGGTNQKFRLTAVDDTTLIPGNYLIASALNENQVLDVERGSREDGANVALFHRNGAENQTFELIPNSDGTYSFRNVNSDKYLDVANNGTAPGTNVLQWTGKGVVNQKWILESAGNGYYYIRSAGNGLYLDVYNNQSADGTNVLVYTKNGGANQKFKLIGVQ